VDAAACLKIVRDIYKSNHFVALCEIKIDSVACGEATLSMIINPEKHTNLYGVVHGGALEALADTAVGVASATVGARVMTLSINMNFIKNIHPGEKATAVARVRHQGRTTIIVDVDTWNEQQELMGRTIATMFVRGQFENIPAKW